MVTCSCFVAIADEDVDDGVNWVPVSMDELESVLYEQLGYTPRLEMELGGSGEVYVLSILLRSETIQKMCKRDCDGKIYVADTDLLALQYGELAPYASKYRNSLILFYPTESENGYVYLNDDSNIHILKSKYDDDTFYFIEENNQFALPVTFYDVLPNGALVIDGEEFAQAVYEFELLNK